MAKRYSGAQEDHPARSNPIKLGVAAHSIKSRVHKSEKTVGFTECNKSVRLNQLDNQIRSMMEFLQKSCQRWTHHAKDKNLQTLRKESIYSNIKTHIEANHIIGFAHACEICGKTSRLGNGLKKHKRKEH